MDKQKARELAKSGGDVDTFELGWLQFKTLAHYHYLPEKSYRTIYFYHHKVGSKSILGFFVPTSKKASVFVVDTVRSNQMPNLNNMYNSERAAYISKGGTEGSVPEGDYVFEIRVETDFR
jgi:DNA polymerase epsilon subunit 1